MSRFGASVTRRHSHSPPDLLGSSDHGDFFDYDITAATETDSFTPKDPAWLSGEHSWKARVSRFLWAAWRGPRHPEDLPPRAIARLAFLEALPEKVCARASARKRALFFVVYAALWLLLWSRTLLPYLRHAPLGPEGTTVVPLTCGQADDFWKGKNAACGLNAQACPQFDLSSDVVFRCPALCDRGSWLYSLRAVGDQVVKYRGYFIGGGKPPKGSKSALSQPYRADSFPCGAAVHAGVVSPFFGGCARIAYEDGIQKGFKSVPGSYGVSDSIAFESAFPFAFHFKALAASFTHCADPRLVVLVLNIVLGAPVVFFALGAVFYWTLAAVGFWTITLATDPPVLVDPSNPETFYSLLSLGLERFLPTCFVLYVLWAVSVKRTFGPLNRVSVLDETSSANPPQSPLTRLILWYPLFWLGVLNNISFDRLPVDRLTWHDLQVQPGALLTVAVVGLILVGCVVAQTYYVWLSGRFWSLLLVYGLVFGGFFVLAELPGMTLRIHHYIFALMFIPGCLTRGKTAIAFQGILLGLFLSGVARWGFASIAETDFSLLRGEPLGQIAHPTFGALKDGILHWKEPEFPKSAAGTYEQFSYISILINDIEWVREEDVGGVDLHELISESGMFPAGSKDENKVYVRLAKYHPTKKRYGDYTRAAVVTVPSYKLTPPPPGIT